MVGIGQGEIGLVFGELALEVIVVVRRLQVEFDTW